VDGCALSPAAPLISAATVLEATIMLEMRLGDAGGREFDLWLLKIGAEVVSVDAEQTDAALRSRSQFRRLFRL
jgi:ribonuclease VapC